MKVTMVMTFWEKTLVHSEFFRIFAAGRRIKENKRE
jgi:hypothetical protein